MLRQEAEDEWRRALALADERGFPVHGLHAAVGYAQHLADQGRAAAGADELRGWLARCPEGVTTPVLVAASGVLADLAHAAGAT